MLAPAAGHAGGSEAAGLLAAVNSARAEHGLQPLHLDATLARAAHFHSDEMLRDGSFGHGAFRTRMISFHVHGPFVGENLAWGGGTYAAPETIVGEWLSSPEHRANLLRPGYDRVGIGTATGTFAGHAGAVLVTADFGGR